MDVSTGALIVILLGVTALIGGVILGVFLYRLDRREAARGQLLTHPRRRDGSAARLDDRRPHAA